MPDADLIAEIKEKGLDQPKRGRGRPKGSKNKHPAAKSALIDPATGVAVMKESDKAIVKRIGDERVTAFVQYHIDMLKMRQGVNKNDVNELYQRFYTYLAYCAEHQIIPNNMNCYFALGILKEEIYQWKNGIAKTPAHKQFAIDVQQFFASIHEQGPTEGLLNPISAMFWQKAHDGMIEASKVEVVNSDPLGDRASAEDIATKYADVQLPD